MAAASPIIREEEKYERLSDLYLTLWKQLDLVCASGHWLEVRRLDQAELIARAKAILDELAPYLPESEPLTDVIYKDFRKTQRFLEHATVQKAGVAAVEEIEGTKLEAFKDYLRDHALRLSQAAEEN
jgi:hypothetical protein